MMVAERGTTRGCNGPHRHFVPIAADEPQGRYAGNENGVFVTSLDLDENRAWALGMETRTGVLFIEEGLRSFAQLNARNDFFPASMVLISSGVEHLLKIDLALVIERISGRLPSGTELRARGGRDGHSVALLLRALLEEAEQSSNLRMTLGVETLRAVDEHHLAPLVLETLTELARADRRYFFLEMFLTGAESDGDPSGAVARLDAEIDRLTTEDQGGRSMGALMSFVVTDQMGKYYKLRNQLVLECVQMVVHGLALLHRDLSPVQEPLLEPWIDLEWFGEPPPRSRRRRRDSGLTDG